MKKSYLPFLVALCALISSCSNDDNVPVNQEQTLLKSYKVSRDTNGRYSIDYELVEGAHVEMEKDAATNTNKIQAFDGYSGLDNKKQSLELENDKIKIGVFENSIQKNSITVEDENIVMGKGLINPNFLQSYSVEYFQGANYVLDFTVKEGISVNFEYNANENIYEVHLKEDETASSTTFTKIYTKSPSLPLKIDFVNYIKVNNEGAKSSDLSRSIAYQTKRMPRYGDGGSIY
ncbi:hypothetical protein [Tenacibaculum amylolyticum]|uniref:hypothetical protein n=1 Tax=Tenacibaculum amylolyticum TaxID=104269 RepID=UPI003894A99F